MVMIGPKKRLKWRLGDMAEAGLRVFLLLLFIDLENRWEPFVRKIHPEEIWLYRNPKTPSYVPGHLLWKMATFIPLLAIVSVYIGRRCKEDLRSAVLVSTLAIPLTGCITNIIKISVGRYRPDFVYRCWPDGQIPDNAFDFENLACTGDSTMVAQGRKSFPSGHSSFSFSTFGFLFLYFSGKVGTFHHTREGSGWKLFGSLTCLLVPLAIAMSRTADYHHHWQDVVVGSFLGFFVTFLVYRQYYPSILSLDSALPFSVLDSSQSANYNAVFNNNNNNNSPAVKSPREDGKYLIQEP